MGPILLTFQYFLAVLIWKNLTRVLAVLLLLIQIYLISIKVEFFFFVNEDLMQNIFQLDVVIPLNIHVGLVSHRVAVKRDAWLVFIES